MTSLGGRCSRGSEKRFGMAGFFAAGFFDAGFFDEGFFAEGFFAEGFFGPGVLTAAGLFALREVVVARFFADFGVATGRECSQTRRFGATLR